MARQLPRQIARIARPAPEVAAAMAAAFPDASPSQIRAWALDAARLQLETALTRPRYAVLSAADARSRTEVIGGRYLARAIEAGRGAVLVSAHFGLHAWPPIAMKLLGWPVQVQRVMLPDRELSPSFAASQARRRQMEDRLPVRYLDTTPDESPLLSVLAAGEALILGGDGAGQGKLIGGDWRAPLLGRELPWPGRPFSLAERAQVPLLSLFPESREGSTRLQIEPLDSADPRTQYLERYRQWLALYPDQWLFWREWGAAR